MSEWLKEHASKAKRASAFKQSLHGSPTRDQPLSLPNRSLDVPPQTQMFFKVSSLTYHSPITIGDDI